MRAGSVALAAKPHSRRDARQTRPVQPRPGESDEHVNARHRRGARSVTYTIWNELPPPPNQHGALNTRASPGRRDAFTDAVLP